MKLVCDNMLKTNESVNIPSSHPKKKTCRNTNSIFFRTTRHVSHLTPTCLHRIMDPNAPITASGHDDASSSFADLKWLRVPTKQQTAQWQQQQLRHR
jgi:hypothetical protein